MQCSRLFACHNAAYDRILPFPKISMSMFSAKKKAPAVQACIGCMIMQWLTALFLLVGAIASLIGAYMAHVLPEGVVFGSTNGSLALIAFTLSIVLLSKQMKKCCPCGGCGCACPMPMTSSKK